MFKGCFNQGQKVKSTQYFLIRILKYQKIKIPYLVLALFPILCLWPLSSLLFTVKNDALTYYFPIRTLISDALHNGELPFWTPYLNMGYPLHADMQSASWNPIVWIFAFVTNYSLVGFHLELFFYFIFSGIGFYQLAKSFRVRGDVALIIALSYQCSGFMLDSVQFFACISSACYIPWILFFYKKVLFTKERKNIVALALSLFLLFTGGYPAFFITTFYLIIGFLILYFFISDNKKIFLFGSATSLAIVGLLFIVLALPAILSYLQFLLYFNRGTTLPLAVALENSMNPNTSLSSLYPFASSGSDVFLSSNILMRNIYMGAFVPLFVVYGIISKAIFKDKISFCLFISSILLLTIAFGEHFFTRQLAYYTVPFMKSFRHAGIFRYFFILLMLLLSGRIITRWLQSGRKVSEQNILSRVLVLLIAITISIGLYSIFILKNDHITFSISDFKAIIQNGSFSKKYLLQLPFVLLNLIVLLIAVRQRRFKLLALAVFVDLFTFCQFQMPVTVIGSKTFSEIKKIVEPNPHKFNITTNESIAELSVGTFDSTMTTGTSVLFQKKITRNDYYITPGNIATQENFYTSKIKDSIFKKPVLYLKNSTSPLTDHRILITKFTSNYLYIEVNIAEQDSLIFLQNIYPGWKASIDNIPTKILKTNITFMALAIPTGKHIVRWEYKPKAVIAAFYTTFILFWGCVIFCFLSFGKLLSKKHRKEN